MKKTEKLPLLVVSDAKGNVFEVPELLMLGSSCGKVVLPDKKDIMPLPFGSNLYMLPGRHPVGYDPKTGKNVVLKKYKGQPVFAACAFMAPAHLQILTAHYVEKKDAPRLPLYSYTAVGWQADGFVVPAIRIDKDDRQDLCNVDHEKIRINSEKTIKRYPANRLVHHLISNCVFRYGCPAARNFAMQRWEAPIPTSMSCNASCLGCISKQRDGFGFPASHDRISFVPSPEEIAEYTVEHLEHAENPVVSFGQGCEGEPLMNADVLVKAVRLIRKQTSKGIVNLNTNASKPESIARLCDAGLDSIRVSLSSARKKWYEAYYRPRGYIFEDVVESMRVARKKKIWMSVNYFVLPGFIDLPAEINAFSKIHEEVHFDMVQTRNLNIDPVWYISRLGLDKAEEQPLGIRKWVEALRALKPVLKLGYYNPPISTMKK